MPVREVMGQDTARAQDIENGIDVFGLADLRRTAPGHTGGQQGTSRFYFKGTMSECVS